MNLSSTQPSDGMSHIQGSATVESKRMQLQTMMLRKALESQQAQSDQMQRETEGKGQIIDLRV